MLAEGTFVHDGQPPTRLAIRFHTKPGKGVTASVEPPPTEPLQPLDDYAAKVLRARRRGLVYPYELTETLAGRGGELVELDLAEVALAKPTGWCRSTVRPAGTRPASSAAR